VYAKHVAKRNVHITFVLHVVQNNLTNKWKMAERAGRIVVPFLLFL